MPSSDLIISGLTKRYDRFVALAPTDLHVAKGEFLTLLGPSGSGKTTLLGLIAGLQPPDGGSIRMGGADITYAPPYERDIGVVFQNYALFPHMTILENISFPLKMRKVAAADIKRRAMEALEMVRLPHIANRLVRELSGGQQQRVALARCMVYRPSMILMDEPLGALDKNLREQMQLEIKQLHRESGTTVIYVTHDQEEAMTMSDRICLMNAGKIEQIGTPREMYFQPKTLFCAEFLGESNIFAGLVSETGATGVEVSLDGNIGLVRAHVANGACAAGTRVEIMVRPQSMSVARDIAGVAMKVCEVMLFGSLTKIYLELEDAGERKFVAAFPTQATGPAFQAGDRVNVSWKREDAVVVGKAEA